MKLEPLMNYYAELEAPLDLGATPFGNRVIVEVTGGEISGDKIKGKFRNFAAADWLTMTEDYGHLDVRATIETHDGALIYLEYFGKLELTEGVQAALAGGGETDYGDQYFMTSPRMQTGDPRYLWVNNIVCVSEGRLRSGRVEYNVYQVVN
ncbi:MAG: DUF3237 domain-containing protein [Gammaproteobacteria bacterium]